MPIFVLARAISSSDEKVVNGGAKTGQDTAIINITSLNDTPDADIAPASYAATENVALSLENNGLSVLDVDSGLAAITAILSVDSGTLDVNAGCNLQQLELLIIELEYTSFGNVENPLTASTADLTAERYLLDRSNEFSGFSFLDDL